MPPCCINLILIGKNTISIESLSPWNNSPHPSAGTCTCRTSGLILRKLWSCSPHWFATMKLYRTSKDIKLVAWFIVQVAPGIHQKTETSAHLITELQSSLCSPVHGLLFGVWRKPVVRSAVWASPLRSGITSPLLPKDHNNREQKSCKCFAIFSIYFFLYLLLSLLFLGERHSKYFKFNFRIEKCC